jgi:hypothetical protein
VLSHHQLELPSLSRLQTSEHCGGGSVLLKCGLKLRSGHLVDRPVVLELTEHVVVLHTWTRARRKGWTLQLLLADHLRGERNQWLSNTCGEGEARGEENVTKAAADVSKPKQAKRGGW